MEVVRGGTINKNDKPRLTDNVVYIIIYMSESNYSILHIIYLSISVHNHYIAFKKVYSKTRKICLNKSERSSSKLPTCKFNVDFKKTSLNYLLKQIKNMYLISTER